jgi:Tfp pilus assembly protein PilO
MEANQLARIKELVRHPAFILGAVAALGLLLSAIMVSMRIAPLSSQSKQLAGELQDLQFQMTTLEKQPIPVKPTEAEQQELMQQIPKDGNYSGLMVTLHEFEGKTGARIVTISFGEKQVQSDLETMISSGQAAKTSMGSTPSTTTNNASLLTPEEVNLGIEGTAAQLNDFMSKLYEAKHLITIHEWSITGGDAAPFADGSSVTSEEPKLKLDITIHIYKAAKDEKAQPKA